MSWNNFINEVIEGDSLELMKLIPNNSIDLVFADPPYNIGIKYDMYKDNRPKSEYLEWSKNWIGHTYNILKDTGSFFLAICDEYVAELNIIAKDEGFIQRNWIIWHYTFGQSQRKKFSRAHTHILYFVKDDKKSKFNDNEIRIPSARQLIYNDRRANPNGKLPDDVWLIPRICGTFKERIEGIPCQIPETLLERIIKASSDEGDIVLDPFAGSGTTLAVAKKLRRKFIGIEISKNYCKLIEKRLKQIRMPILSHGIESSHKRN